MSGAPDTLDITRLQAHEQSPAERLALLPTKERAQVLEGLTDEDASALAWDWGFWGRPDQHPPQGEWNIWGLIAGRGVGKTRTGSEWVRSKGREPAGTHEGVGLLIGADAADVRDLMVEGPSGILACSPQGERPKYEPSKRLLAWPNGMRVHCRSGEDPEAIRGVNAGWCWADEMAKWRYCKEAWDQLRFALREGRHPQTCITTTPKPVVTLREIIKGRYPGTVLAPRMSTYRNRANLAATFLEEMDILYAGTRLGRQELYAELLEDVEGALWTLMMIEAHRKSAPPANTTRRAVAVDPSGTRRGAECGIMVCAADAEKHGWVLADRSRRASPGEWAEAALVAYQEFGCDLIVAEKNFGGEMVEHTLRTVPATAAHPGGHEVRIKLISASVSKTARAEPVVGLYEQGRIHHVGNFPDLESQMTTWVPGDVPAPPSPDRLDAMVWGLTELLITGKDLSGLMVSPGGVSGRNYWGVSGN